MGLPSSDLLLCTLSIIILIIVVIIRVHPLTHSESVTAQSGGVSGYR